MYCRLVWLDYSLDQIGQCSAAGTDAESVNFPADPARGGDALLRGAQQSWQ